MQRTTAQQTIQARKQSRRGAVILIAMVCLLLVMMIGASLMKTAQAERNQVRRAQSRLQADWLVEAAIERATAKLANDLTYSGEVWKIPAKELNGSQSALVTIEVKPSPQQPNRRVINIVADYPIEPEKRARSSKQILMDVGSQNP